MDELEQIKKFILQQGIGDYSDEQSVLCIVREYIEEIQARLCLAQRKLEKIRRLTE